MSSLVNYARCSSRWHSSTSEAEKGGGVKRGAVGGYASTLLQTTSEHHRTCLISPSNNLFQERLPVTEEKIQFNHDTSAEILRASSRIGVLNFHDISA